MLSNKTWGIAGAAMLGTAALLGTNAANAVIDLDATAANKANAAVTFAKETINATTTGSDGMTYYVVSGGESVLNVKAKVGMGGPSNSHLVVDYTFTGMVLGTDSTPRLAISGADSTCESTGTVEPNKRRCEGRQHGVLPHFPEQRYYRSGRHFVLESCKCRSLDEWRQRQR